MMVCIHAAVGAALGRGIDRPASAFAAGSASHLLCDLVPHIDYPIQIEAPLAALMFTYLAVRYGLKSPQFWGAAGAVAPDAENALAVFGVIPQSKTIFPTHNESASWFIGHGSKVTSPASQIAIAIISLLLAGPAKPK